MFSFRTWASRALIVVLVGSLVVLPGATAKDSEKTEDGPLGQPSDQTTPGWILVPTPEAGRLFSPMSANGISQFYLKVEPKAQFSVDSTDSLRMNSCALLVCISTGDFDVVFFQEKSDGSTKVTGRFTAVGAESGVVPDESTFALVFMKTPGTSPEVRGFKFLYSETIGGNPNK